MYCLPFIRLTKLYTPALFASNSRLDVIEFLSCKLDIVIIGIEGLWLGEAEVV